MRYKAWSKGHTSSTTAHIIFCISVLCGILFSSLPHTAAAAIDNPTLYHIEPFDYVAGYFFMTAVPDIYHLSTVTITYGEAVNMLIIDPPEVSMAAANLYYLSEDGQRQFEYRFYDEFHKVPPVYAWTKSGEYEVDIFGITSTSSGNSIYLTTMKFTVVIKGGPKPSCTLSISPNTIYPKQGEGALMEWSSTNAATATIDQEIGTIATSGSMTINPNATTTYTANFNGPNGTATCIATVNVPDPLILPLHEKAANLARKLVNHTEAYLWGGKGWDYSLKEFTTPERILSGYTYNNPNTNSPDTGIGLDCSGLITWAFNRSYNEYAGFNHNYIKYVNADGMFRDHQSSPVVETELRPGDTLTFDWNKDGRMDHVAMYVGGSDGYDVVNAGSERIGITQQQSNIYSKLDGFVSYRRIHQADVALAITTGSPVNLKVTDPNGNTLSATNITASTEEYLREIPGEMYYLEMEQGHDGRPQDTILAPIAKDGTYTIEIVPEVGASPTDTYSLTIEVNGVKTVVVDNETIDTIPDSGFALKLADGEIQSLDPTIKVLLGDLYPTINSLNLSSKQRKQSLLSTLDAALGWFDRNRPDQIIRKLTKLQNDINRHVANELTAEDLNDINQQINHLLLLLKS